MQLTKTSALQRLRELNKRVRIIRGGSSAGKTIAIIAILIDYAIRHKGKEISIVATKTKVLARTASHSYKMR